MLLATAFLLTLASPAGPHRLAPRLVVEVVAAFLAGLAICYSFRWPDRAQSQVFALCGAVGIGAACFAQSDPRLGLIVSTAFFGLAGYVAVFNDLGLLAVVILSGAGTAIVKSIHIADARDTAMAIASALLVCGGLIAVPLCTHLLMIALWINAAMCLTDPLTGLANRRGLHRSTRALIASAAKVESTLLSIALVDIDGFKKFNDVNGHAAGDAILVEVAETLSQLAESDSVIARVGGEEFIIAEVAAHREGEGTADRIRSAIAAASAGVTVSIGVSSALLTSKSDDTNNMITDLIVSADSAMYEAKRAGGNQVRYA